MVNAKEKYIENYMKEEYGALDAENIFVGKFLFRNTKGKVLDFGCGPSLPYWAMFMQNASFIDGFDVLPENISYVRRILNQKQKPTIYNEIANYLQTYLLEQKELNLVERCFKKINKLEVVDMLKSLPFKENFYDCATEIGCIGCVNTNDELITAVKSMYDCLKPHGKAIIVNWMGKQNNGIEEVAQFDGAVPISKDIFKEVFSQVGFKKINIAYKNNPPGYEFKTIIYGTAIK